MAPQQASASIDQRCIDALRFLSVDMVQKADSGHPGLPLGAAPMAYVLWQRFLKHNLADSLWSDRATFFSDNSVGRYRFNPSEANLGEQGYRFNRGARPGQPSLGRVGVNGLAGPPVVDDDWAFRGDFRQER